MFHPCKERIRTQLTLRSSLGTRRQNLLPDNGRDLRFIAEAVEVVGARRVAIGSDVNIVRVKVELPVPGHRQYSGLLREVVIVVCVGVLLFIF